MLYRPGESYSWWHENGDNLLMFSDDDLCNIEILLGHPWVFDYFHAQGVENLT